MLRAETSELLEVDVERVIDMGEGFVSQIAYQRALGFDREVFRTNLYKWASDPNAFLRVLKHDLEPIGFMICFLNACPFYNGNMAQEFAWWVEPPYRGLGLGTDMKAQYTQWAKDKLAASISIGIANFTGTEDKMMEYLFNDGFELVDMSFIKRLD